MRFPAAVLGFLMCAAALAPAKTTYGETRAVPKEDPPDQGGGTGQSGDEGGEDDDDDCRWFCGGSEDGDRGGGDHGSIGFSINPEARGIAACFNLDFEVRGGKQALGTLVILPFWFALCPAVYELAAGPVHLALGNQDSENERRDRLRFGMGFHVGMDWVTETAVGPATGGHIEAVVPLRKAGLGALDLRLRGGYAASSQGMEIDYERDVFEDSAFLGIERDRMDGYSRRDLPLTAELLWFPGSRGFYLGAGAGAALLTETVAIHRESPFYAGDFTAKRETWSPSTTLCIGRESLGRHGKPNWYFELRWRMHVLQPERRSSFPSDNAMDAHGIGWVWGWYL